MKKKFTGSIKFIVVFVMLISGLVSLNAQQQMGDVNTDGKVDILDALGVARSYIDLPDTPFDPDSADVNLDGAVNIIDALIISQHYVGLIPWLPTLPPVLFTPKPVVTPKVSPTSDPAVTPAASPSPVVSNPPGIILIDHRAVDLYDKIPGEYLAKAKEMMINIPGASHGRGFMYGLELLAKIDSCYAVNITWRGEPEAPGNTHLRAVRTYLHPNGRRWVETGGEENFWTNSAAVETMKKHIQTLKDSNPVTLLSYAWSYEVSDNDLVDGWSGRIFLDADQDTYQNPWSIDGSGVNLLDYIAAVEAYENSAPGVTRAFFSTGPVDGGPSGAGKGYQRMLKNDYIREYLRDRGRGILFDYADILSHGNAGDLYTYDFEGIPVPFIHPDNTGAYDGGEGGCHIGENGCLRLGKALWVMAARVAGWNPSL